MFHQYLIAAQLMPNQPSTHIQSELHPWQDNNYSSTSNQAFNQHSIRVIGMAGKAEWGDWGGMAWVAGVARVT